MANLVKRFLRKPVKTVKAVRRLSSNRRRFSWLNRRKPVLESKIEGLGKLLDGMKGKYYASARRDRKKLLLELEASKRELAKVSKKLLKFVG